MSMLCSQGADAPETQTGQLLHLVAPQYALLTSSKLSNRHRMSRVLGMPLLGSVVHSSLPVYRAVVCLGEAR